jgi:glycosyltransferase involved in cell wall biosynthesis
MKEATVFVFPSIWPETLGIVGLEALACGVPAIACDVGGVREWLHPGKTGLLVPPKNSQAIAEAAQTILQSSQLRETMGCNGMALIRSRFSPQGHVSALLNLYRQGCSPSRRAVEAQGGDAHTGFRQEGNFGRST